ncbi:MAG: hypothetical protein ACO3RX_01820 [Chthoniobacterales bacterium]
MAELTELAEAVHTLEAIAEAYPLAVWSPWCRDTQPEDADPELADFDSQRGAIEACLQGNPPNRPILCVCLCGGNGAGKTRAAEKAAIAVGLGKSHPMIRMWLQSTGIRAPYLKDRPGRVLFVAKSSNDSIRYHRPKVGALLPAGGRWYNRNARGEASVVLASEAVSEHGAIAVVGQAEFWFQSADQGREAFQGDEWSAVLIDEELLQTDGEGIFRELLQRVARRGGRIFYSYAALAGPQTWTVRTLEGGRPDFVRIVRLDALDNPHVDREALRATYAGSSPEEVRQRRLGIATSLEGRVYPALDLVNVGGPEGACHVYRASWTPPPEWRRFVGVDVGWARPSAVVWTAIDPDGRHFDYRILYAVRMTAPQLAQAAAWLSGSPRIAEPPPIPERAGHGRYRAVSGADRVPPFEGVDRRGRRRLQWGERIEGAWIDSAAPEAVRAFGAVGFSAMPAHKSWSETVGHLRELSGIAGDGRPRWYIRSDLDPLIAELAAYVHAPDRLGTSEKPAKGDDHACDAKRYQAWGVRGYLGA